MDNRVPKFCSVWGVRLVSSGKVIGFDPFTGEPESVEKLHCPNPTVVSSLGRVQRTFHPAWENFDGVWTNI